MNRWGSAMGLAMLVLVAAACAAAEPPGGTMSELQVTKATVEKINLSSREVTIREDDSGNLETVIVGPDVRNLDQVRVGDKVTFTHYEELSISVAPPGGSPSFTEMVNDRRTPMGGKPGRKVTNVVEKTVTIIALDPANRTAVIREHSGDLRTIRVSDRMNLDGIKAGDQVVMRRTEAVGISVENP